MNQIVFVSLILFNQNVNQKRFFFLTFLTTILTVLRFAFTSFKRTNLKPIAIKLNSSAISYLIRALKINNVIALRYAFLVRD